MKELIYTTDSARHQSREGLYLKVRQAEGRILSDAAVRQLPDVPGSSPYAREWAWRRRSFCRFRKYLLRKNRPLRILDLGCGNGWMSNRLAEQPRWEVWAVDLNQVELEQGARLFGRDNLRFLYADVMEGKLPNAHFDVIVLAAAVQYFSDLNALVTVLRHLLRPEGEIHILDSAFYLDERARLAAKSRSLTYYTGVGVPEMAPYYFHHLWPLARQLGADNLNASVKIWLLQRVKWISSFPWLRLRRDLEG